MKNKIIHIGPMPPPIGGISVYLYRLSKINKDKNIIFINEVDLSKKQFVKFILDGSNNVFVYHTPSLRRRITLYILTFFSTNKYVIVSHGEGLENSYIKSNYIGKWLLKKTILNSSYIQIVGSHLEDFLLNIGYSKEKIIIKNAFLEPPQEDEDKILNTYPSEVNYFINKHERILIANASSIVFYIDGTELYGLDMCVELTAKLKNNFLNIGFIFALANENVNTEYLKKMKQRIKELDIEDNFYFLAGQKELWPLFKKADLMIRPTSSDGYGVSVAESLYFGCSAIASDVCIRPNGTILFKNRDLEDLYKKTTKVFDEM